MLLGEFRKHSRRQDIDDRAWEMYLKGPEQFIEVTFNSEWARAPPEGMFLTPVHPLVRQAAMSFDGLSPLSTRVSLCSDATAAGFYPFAVYHWSYRGFRNDSKLIFVGLDEGLESELTAALVSGEVESFQSEEELGLESVQELQDSHYVKWQKAREEHIKKTEKAIAKRRASLARSHHASVKLIKSQLAQAENEKIIRMKESELRGKEEAYERKLRGFDADVSSSDIHIVDLVFGVLQVCAPTG